MNDNSFNNIESIKDLKNQIFMIHGVNDSIASFSIAQDMYDTIKSTEKHFISFIDEGHNYSRYDVLLGPISIIKEEILNE